MKGFKKSSMLLQNLPFNVSLDYRKEEVHFVIGFNLLVIELKSERYKNIYRLSLYF